MMLARVKCPPKLPDPTDTNIKPPMQEVVPCNVDIMTPKRLLKQSRLAASVTPCQPLFTLVVQHRLRVGDMHCSPARLMIPCQSLRQRTGGPQ